MFSSEGTKVLVLPAESTHQRMKTTATSQKWTANHFKNPTAPSEVGELVNSGLRVAVGLNVFVDISVLLPFVTRRLGGSSAEVDLQLWKVGG